MAEKKTTEQFIFDAKIIHNNFYDYSKAEYVNSKTKLVITCPLHGDFLQSPNNHLHGFGCKPCGIAKNGGSIAKTTEQFIESAIKVHGNKYEYSLTNYIGDKNKIVIICKVHGNFSQIPSNHIQGNGCPVCGRIISSNNNKNTTSKFIELANKIHNNFYNYSKAKYVNSKTKLVITCPLHGDFLQRPEAHTTSKRGCPSCGVEKSKVNNSKSKKTLDTFISKANEIHMNFYDYSETDYINRYTKVDIICPIHGKFSQTPSNHLTNGNGCRKCSIVNATKTTKEFVLQAMEVHGRGIYDYSETDYTGDRNIVTITCPKGHRFYQKPHDHLKGCGCNVCSQNLVTSKGEKDVFDFITENTDLLVTPNTRSVIPPYELDIFLPDLNLAIEFNGMYWHSEKHKANDYHIKKFNMCASKGVRLIQIWENEWIEQRQLCEAFIKSLLKSSIKLYARKLSMKSVTTNEQRSFLSQYHFQGYVGATKCLGLYTADNDLIQLMSLKKLDSKGNYEIGRLCTKSGYSVVGGSERLFKNLLQDLDYLSIISFNNLDKFTGEVYSRLGMKLEKSQNNSYFYTNGVESFSRQQFQKHKLVAQGHDPNLTEYQIANSMGYFRVFPTGNSKYILSHKF